MNKVPHTLYQLILQSSVDRREECHRAGGGRSDIRQCPPSSLRSVRGLQTGQEPVQREVQLREAKYRGQERGLDLQVQKYRMATLKNPTISSNLVNLLNQVWTEDSGGRQAASETGLQSHPSLLRQLQRLEEKWRKYNMNIFFVSGKDYKWRK